MNLLDVFSLPMGAGPGARPIGMSEFGTPRYRTATGQEYTVRPPMGRETQRPEPRPSPLMEILQQEYGEQRRAARHGKGGDGSNPLGGILRSLAEGALQGVTAPGRALQGEPVTLGDAWATALDFGGIANVAPAPAGALRSGNARTQGIRAYHGSPHDFDRFSMDKIGTGEGSGLAGRGLYFTPDEDVARSYRDSIRMRSAAHDAAQRGELDKFEANLVAQMEDVRARQASGELPPFLASQELQALNFDRKDLERVKAMSPTEIASDGHMYEVSINAERKDFADLGDMPSPQDGERIKNAGGVGARFLDRGAENFVVFDDSLISIIRKYGLAAVAAGLGLTAADLEAQAQEAGVSLAP